MLMDTSKMDKTVAPPPCTMEGTDEAKAEGMAKGFLQNVYGAMDSGNHTQIPFNAESIVSFQKGDADRFQGPSLMPRLQQMHKGAERDLSGLSVQIFPGNSMLCLVNGAMTTAASTQASQAVGTAIPHRFADFFLVCQDAQGPHVRNAVFREVDEDCGPAPAGAATGEAFTKATQIAQQFVPFFYGQLDDPAKRGGLNSLFRDISCLTVGSDLFKGQAHIAHKVHYLPALLNTGARNIEGVDAQPSPAGGFFLFVHGFLQLAGEEHKVRFYDVFHLMAEGNNFWISNLLMKLHGGV